MAVVKWIFVALFGIGALGALGIAFTSGGVSRKPNPRTPPPIALREFPPVGALANAVAPAPVAVFFHARRFDIDRFRHARSGLRLSLLANGNGVVQSAKFQSA